MQGLLIFALFFSLPGYTHIRVCTLKCPHRYTHFSELIENAQTADTMNY